MLPSFLSTYKRFKLMDSMEYTISIPSSKLDELEKKMAQFMKWTQISNITMDHYQKELLKGKMIEFVILKDEVPLLFVSFMVNHRYRLQAVTLSSSSTNQRLNAYLKKKYNNTSIFKSINEPNWSLPIEEAYKQRLSYLFKND